MTTEKAILAGGCFWCMQPVFDRLEGVVSTAVGYSGGDIANPSYEAVCRGDTGHREVIQVEFDPEIVSYREILQAFWRSISPTQTDGQFNDIGEHYRTAIYYHSEAQKEQAIQSVKELEASGFIDGTVATELLPAKDFYPAEEEHQGYYQKNALHYELYSEGSGRAPYLRKVWGKGS